MKRLFNSILLCCLTVAVSAQQKTPADRSVASLVAANKDGLAKAFSGLAHGPQPGFQPDESDSSYKKAGALFYRTGATAPGLYRYNGASWGMVPLPVEIKAFADSLYIQNQIITSQAASAYINGFIKLTSLKIYSSTDSLTFNFSGGTKTTSANYIAHVLAAPSQPGAMRMQWEPNGVIASGTTVKNDFLLDPFDSDQNNYRLGNLLGRVGSLVSLNGENGAFQITSKSVGLNAGVYPSIQIGHNDANTVDMKSFYYDVSQTAWYKPMKGAWRTAMAYNAGDYVLNGLKLYVSAGAGTSGATIPSQTNGTASDGGVSWTYVTTFVPANFKAQILFGNLADMPKFGFPAVGIQSSRDFLIWNRAKINWLNSTDVNQFDMGVTSGGSDFAIRNLVTGGYYQLQAAGGQRFYENSTQTGNNAGVTIEQSGAGDAVLQWLTTGTDRFMSGLKKSGSGIYHMGFQSALGATDALTISKATNSVTLTNTPMAPIAATANTGQIATLGTVFGERTAAATLTQKTLTTPKLSGYTVSTLPAGSIGMVAYVTDALGPAPLATVTGGGSSVVPVFYNGTNWIVE